MEFLKMLEEILMFAVVEVSWESPHFTGAETEVWGVGGYTQKHRRRETGPGLDAPVSSLVHDRPVRITFPSERCRRRGITHDEELAVKTPPPFRGSQ